METIIQKTLRTLLDKFGAEYLCVTVGEEAGHEEGVSEYKAEQSVSSAILNVTSDTQQKVCFTQGHDEWPFEGMGGQSLGPIRQGLVGQRAPMLLDGTRLKMIFLHRQI